MIEILMDYSRMLEIRKSMPQPRRHKCAVCATIFICHRCTIVMTSAYKRGDWALTCRKCQAPTHKEAASLDKGFLCPKCYVD